MPIHRSEAVVSLVGLVDDYVRKQKRGQLAVTLRKRGDELKALPEGWDSYGGSRIDGETVDRAIEIALALAPQFSIEPSLVPGSDGTVQVEWHADGFNVEVWINRA